MTGKDLIIYILANNLENEPVFKDGIFIGLVSEKELAVRYKVGVATIRTWYDRGLLKGLKIGEEVFVWPIGDELAHLNSMIRKE